MRTSRIDLLRAKLYWLVIEKIKSINILYQLFTSVRAWKIKNAYCKTVHYYGKLQSQESHMNLLLARRLQRAKKPLDPKKKLQILYVGTDYLQDSSGILQALSTLGKLTFFTREGGEYGQYLSRAIHHKYSPSSDSVPDLKKLNAERLLAIVDELSRNDKTPDIIIGQMWAGWLEGCALGEIRRKFGSIIVNICMDDRQSYWGGHKLRGTTGTYGLIPYIDIAATSAPECVEWYLKEKCPAFFFPLASDPKIFHPMLDLPKKYDVSFVGGCYGIRKELVNHLIAGGIQVEAWGSGWSNGRLSTEDVPRLFAQSKIILGVGTISHCKDFYALKMRDFDGPMSGTLYLTHDNPDLKRVYNVGEEIAVYSSFNDCLQKIRYFLQHDLKREKVAKAGLERAQKDHTWEKRFHHLIETIRSCT